MANIVLVNRHSNRHLDDVGAQQYWKFECVSGGEVWSGVKGYASRYYFYREKYKDDVEKAPWFFGHLGASSSAPCSRHLGAHGPSVHVSHWRRMHTTRRGLLKTNVQEYR